ncbi:hypothetical protein KUCAC02_023351 [Chaenocephalus aceratus]|uniref:Uncharacterized protein n=1 Tax=Chaenocephalus aceratus TaxID=36190 RepID=A0ACB9XPT6_CHAAC|nr:hypothetical protein KUCAC02_023351 [Chaenocephalus aceratus]
MTWPEVLRAYCESDREYHHVLPYQEVDEYPYGPLESKIKVLQFLVDQFLTTNIARDELMSNYYFLPCFPNLVFPEDYLRPPKSFPGLNQYSKAYTPPRLPLFPQQLLLKLQQRQLPMWLAKLYLRPFTLHLLQ